MSPKRPSAPSRGPLQGLADLAAQLEGEPERTSSFVRGLAIGALVGAAIAGSAIWQRRTTRRRNDTPRGDGA